MDRSTPQFPSRPHCCPSHCPDLGTGALSRREFLECSAGAVVGGIALAQLSWAALTGSPGEEAAPPGRRALRVKPVLVYDVPQRRAQTSWRGWGGIQSQEAASAEVGRIESELRSLRERADFPVQFEPVAAIRGAGELAGLGDLGAVDVLLVYPAGGWMDTFEALAKLGKPLLFFCRHKSGPLYLWYEIISPRYLRQHTDKLAVGGVDEDDVVIDSQDEILWRLRSLCGLVNTVGTRVLAVGGPGAWSQPAGVVPKLVQEKWKFEIHTVSYDELGKLIKEARADSQAVERARQRGEEYLRAPGTTLETDRSFVHNAFLLDDIFRRIMHEADCRAITINDCMSTIMPLAETTACLPLSTLNDAGYRAFCESDFVVIPAGVLLANIAGRPFFMNDPTYPHDGLITLAHCTAPRRMNGQSSEPARILTHFESDYGAAPKVEMAKGQAVTNILSDFKFERWVGVKGEIAAAPFLDICRSQIDVRFACDSLKLAQRMPGFHWMTAYGDYLRETGYALKRIPIAWEVLA